MSGFLLLPAIDVRAGHVVRLRQGDYARETCYADDPLALAQRYADAGASWLHLVDLDAAREGGYTLAPLLAQIRASTSLRVQTGGGIRDESDVARLLEAGADRVVIGSLAVREPATVQRWLASFGAERITVAFDVRKVGDRWRLPTEGWTRQSGVMLDELLAGYAATGLRHALCTDIDRDGMLAGPNLELYRSILALVPTLQLQASGGVRGVQDVVDARAAGCSSAVLGKALIEGRFELRDALREVRPC
ncbi:1-(5-phosphoribosyl)-5-[(5-phosphoribosylamino)methylideneamino]imidazole-4-carboxamide isomerase [Lysobacter sp. P5_B9]